MEKRTIKFRAYNTATREMEPVLQIDFVNQCVFVLPERNLEGGNQEYWMLSNTRLMQSTSLLDKEGREIYEGDILKYTSSNDSMNFSCFEVFFHDGDANSDYNIGYSIHRMHCHGNIAGGVIPSFKPKTTKQMEVIGNIYENPDLLK